ncbi:hypothetical protein TNCV_306191 [Trichonephila clavipes]|nr:hypothetical protein TNCV_306191 [Trichonephila clavipes]
MQPNCLFRRDKFITELFKLSACDTSPSFLATIFSDYPPLFIYADSDLNDSCVILFEFHSQTFQLGETFRYTLKVKNVIRSATPFWQKSGKKGKATNFFTVMDGRMDLLGKTRLQVKRWNIAGDGM